VGVEVINTGEDGVAEGSSARAALGAERGDEGDAEDPDLGGGVGDK